MYNSKRRSSQQMLAIATDLDAKWILVHGNGVLWEAGVVGVLGWRGGVMSEIPVN